MVLLTADAGGSRADPAFEAHAAPIKYWALAIWEKWQAPDLMAESFNHAAARLRKAKRSVWDLVAGPAAALIATLWRLEWTILSPTRFRTQAGLEVDLTLDSPAAVVFQVRTDVRRWQLEQAAASFPNLVPPAPDAGPPDSGSGTALAAPRYRPPPLPVCQATVGRLPRSAHGILQPVGRLLEGRRGAHGKVDGWEPQHRAYLKSAMDGGQWPQVRVAQLAQDDTDRACQMTSNKAVLPSAYCMPRRPILATISGCDKNFVMRSAGFHFPTFSTWSLPLLTAS